jgi:hypothetical protein
MKKPVSPIGLNKMLTWTDITEHFVRMQTLALLFDKLARTSLILWQRKCLLSANAYGKNYINTMEA